MHRSRCPHLASATGGAPSDLFLLLGRGLYFFLVLLGEALDMEKHRGQT